jgi:hypothetical protein
MPFSPPRNAVLFILACDDHSPVTVVVGSGRLSGPCPVDSSLPAEPWREPPKEKRTADDFGGTPVGRE